MKSTLFGMTLILLFSFSAFSISVKYETSGIQNLSDNAVFSRQSAEQVDGVHYEWQQLNGYCHWAAISMILQSAGVPLDLAGVFAASGIGCATFMVREEAAMHFWPGPWVRQMGPVMILSEFYGLNTTFCMDSESELGSSLAQILESAGFNVKRTSGEIEAFDILRATIDAGYPLSLWVDPYYLPPEDYDIVRTLNITYAQTSAGHSIVAVGYNDTAQTALIMDPGTGACEPNYGYPSDGRWNYPINYTTLNDAWAALGYGTIIMQPGSGPVADFDYQLVNLICSRLLGDRASYAPDLVDVPSVFFGSSAFRQLAFDLNPQGLTEYLNEKSPISTIRQIHIDSLAILGPYIETMMTIQYWSYKGALEALPKIVTDYDLTTFIEIGKQALPHLAALSHNASLTVIGSPTHHSLMMDTFLGLGRELQNSGNLGYSFASYSAELTEISGHLTAIANVWEAAGLHLSTLLGHNPPPLLISVGLGVSIIIILAIAGFFLYRRRLRHSTSPETAGA